MENDDPSKLSELDPSVEATEMEGEDPLVGAQIGKYSIVAKVAKGGTATVYRALDTVLNREVAVKILHEHLESRREVVERFKNEALVVASLRHPNIVNVYDFLNFEKRSLLVVEYVPGITLSSLIKRFRKIPENFVLMIGLDILQGLRAAHEKGVTHRDIKPANILLHPEMGVKISDFGLAKLLNSDDGLTKDGIFIGTPSFSSPEQIEGKPIDHRSDLFSLGLTLYMLATGLHAFKQKGDTTTTVWFKIVRGKFQAIRELDPSISKDFEKILDRCLQVDPNKRYPTAKAMADDFLEILKRRKLYPHAESLRNFLTSPYSSDSPQASVFGSSKVLLLKTMKYGSLAAAIAGGAYYLYWSDLVKNDSTQNHSSGPPEVSSADSETVESIPTLPERNLEKARAPSKSALPKSPVNLPLGMKSGRSLLAVADMKLVTKVSNAEFALRFRWKDPLATFRISRDSSFRDLILESKFRDTGFDWTGWSEGQYFYQLGTEKSHLEIEDWTNYRLRMAQRKRDLVVSDDFNDVDLQMNPWTQQLKLSWDSGPTAVGYRLEVANDPQFKNPIFSGVPFSKSSLIERNWDRDQIIYWRVSYLDESRNVFLVDPVRKINLKLTGQAPYIDLIKPNLDSNLKADSKVVELDFIGPRNSKIECSWDASQLGEKAWMLLKDKESHFVAQLKKEGRLLACRASEGKSDIRYFVLDLN
ncbi:MAG: hypothetical protein COV44_03035 [Deltaproteobacteria bacterium CG11_big_fil_rev_8_21_14_0_20_45_16]|nr:MAG: hypothetical protein COV44_03035 [Deltaproteobacteria bacterium CG11_big_fil_rev_8_21_14_0_20_45_16]